MNDKNKKRTTKKKNDTPPDTLADLRQKAEKKLKIETERVRKLSTKDLKDLAHELGTHQIELEMQNEELRRARVELEESHALYVDLYDFSPMGYFIFDRNGLIKEVNVTGANLLGTEKRFLRGRPFPTFVDPDHRPVFRNHLSEVFTTQTASSCEVVLLRNDDTKIHARLHSLSFVMGEGDPGVFRTAIIDITEQKRAEKELRKSQELLRSIIEGTSDAVYVKDAHGGYLLFNSAAEGITGKKAGDVLGKDDAFLFPPQEAKAVMDGDRAVMNSRSQKTYEETVTTATGEKRTYLSTKGPLFDDAGRVIGLFGIARDITERKRAEEEIRKLNEGLKRSLLDKEAVNKELEAFSYSVSHDLRAPLRSIEGFTAGILEDSESTLSGTSRDYFQRVLSASQRMSQLIDAMLSLARLTKGELKEKAVRLSDLAEVIANELQKKDPSRRVEFIIAKGVKTQGDMDMLRMVLENLLDNAWKFTGKHPSATIEFGATQKDDRIVYFVRDDGVGFTMKYAGKLFQPFSRLHTAGEFPGLGIGLATVKRIIHRHGGTIWAESAPEQGATFYFTLD